MAKKAIHHFNRGLVIGVEIIGLFAMIFFLLWIGLLMRLAQGPLNVDFLTARLEKTLNSDQAGFSFDVATTMLTWGGRLEPIEVEMRNVQITRADNTPVLAIERIGVQLSKRNLAVGKIVPKVIKIYGPALRVIRWEDGHFTLNLGASAAPASTPEEGPPPATDESQVQLIQGLLSQLREKGGTGLQALLGGLRQISVTNAAVFYEDRVLNVAWKSKESDIVFARAKSGLVANALVDIEMDQARSAKIRSSFYYTWDAKTTEALIHFSGIVPSDVVQKSEQLKDLSGLSFPLKGSLAFTLDPHFMPGEMRFVIGSDPGTVSGLGLYEHPLALQGLYMTGHADPMRLAAELEQVQVDFGGPRVEAKASVATESGVTSLRVNATLFDMPMDDLKRYWPEKLTPDPRAWVTENLSKGIASRATLDLEMAYDPAAPKKVTVGKVGGEIDFQGITVDYFPPLMPVTGAAGRAFYDHKSFTLDISGGSLGDMAVTKSDIRITDLDIQSETVHSKIDISVKLSGPLKTALKVLDSDPLNYPADMGIKTAEVGGQAAAEVSFAFPLHKALDVADVKVHADATLRDVMLKDLVSGFDLTGGPMTLSVDNATLKVAGSGRLGHMPLTFDWDKSFDAKTAIASQVRAKLPLDAPALYQFGFPKDLPLAGVMPAEVDYRQDHGGKAVLSLKGDISDLTFSVPPLSYTKPAQERGDASLTLHLLKDRPERISGIRVNLPSLAAEGSVALDAAGAAVSKAFFSRLAFGETDIALEAEALGSEGYALKVAGRQLDASTLFREGDAPGSDAAAAETVTPIRLNLDVDRLLTGKDRSIAKVKAFLHRNKWQRLEQLEMDAIAGGKPVYLRYMPEGKGHALRFEADNAGAALQALGIAKSIRGGKLVVKGLPAAGAKAGPRDMQGAVMLTDFSLKDAPVVAKLLNAMSLPGLMQLLGGEGVSFKKARVDFTWTDRGQPDGQKNVRLLGLRDGQTSGSSLGLTFEGKIDNWNNIYDLDGTIIPVSDLNKLISIIPIVGDVLTAGGEGMIAATYKIKGPKSQPVVTVNPLAALAPGILRKLFFEN